MKELRTEKTRADIAQAILRLEGNTYSLVNYPMFEGIFNTPADRIVMRSGRQVSKTITESANIILDTSLNPYYPVIYANSSSKQTQAFSSSKLDPFLIQSPVIYKSCMKAAHVINNVYSKRLKNFSEIHLSYFSESADRVRGTTGNSIYLDEVQDMLYDAIIDAEQCLSAARYPKFTYAGTSKSMLSALEYFWLQSSQNEWIIPCEGCNKWNRPYMDIIGKHGIICKKCGKSLNTYKGRWYSFSEEDEPEIDGFWVPQIIMPMHCQVPSKWAQLLSNLEKYPEHKFLNEVMGLPIGEGSQTITEAMLRGMCNENLPMYQKRCPENSRNAMHVAAGIDWGGGTSASRTVLSIYAVYPEKPKFVKIFGKIYDAGEPSKHVEDIAYWVRRFRVIMAFGDHGGGNFAMSQLRSMIPDIRVVPVMYTEQNRPYRWDDAAARYTVNRTIMIDSFLMDIKQNIVEAVRWEDFAEFAVDFLNVFEEIIGEKSGIPRRVWRKYPEKPDDSLHSMVFGWFACRVLSGMLDFTAASPSTSI